MIPEDDSEKTPPSTDGELHPQHYSAPFPTVTGSTPTSMFEWDMLSRVQRLERTVDKQDEYVASLVASRKTWRWVAGIGGPVIFSALVTVMIYCAGAVVSSAERVGQMTARIEAQGQLISVLLGEISALRSEVRRISGLPAVPDAKGYFMYPDKLSVR